MYLCVANAYLYVHQLVTDIFPICFTASYQKKKTLRYQLWLASGNLENVASRPKRKIEIFRLCRLQILPLSYDSIKFTGKNSIDYTNKCLLKLFKCFIGWFTTQCVTYVQWTSLQITMHVRMYYNKFYMNVCLIEALKIQLCNVLCDIFTGAEELCGQGGQLPSQLLAALLYSRAGFNSPRFILTRVRYIS